MADLVPSSLPRPNLVLDEGYQPRPLVPPYRDEDEGRGIGRTAIQDHRDEVTEWQQRLQVAVEQTLRRRAARRDLRQQLAARRDAGLAVRHRQKLARSHQEENVPHPAPDAPIVVDVTALGGADRMALAAVLTRAAGQRSIRPGVAVVLGHVAVAVRASVAVLAGDEPAPRARGARGTGRGRDLEAKP